MKPWVSLDEVQALFMASIPLQLSIGMNQYAQMNDSDFVQKLYDTHRMMTF